MILLDDAQSTVSNPSSRLYQYPLKYWCIYEEKNPDDNLQATEHCLQEISAALARGEFVVTAFAYELGRQFHNLVQRPSAHPLIQAWSFQSFQKLSKDEVDSYLIRTIGSLDPNNQSAGVANVSTSLGKVGFAKDIESIQEYIRNGDTYQINLTYQVIGEVYGDPLALYARLRKRQPGRFGAFIKDKSHYILSQSPELFIQRTGQTLIAMPMKGTARAINDEGESASHLSQDPKNQAENVMIVDLLRNDLSRLALPGTVSVPKLFEVARHGDVLQMTSTVKAQAKPNLKLFDILAAVFPCGSVTGAPKKRSMQLIQELESNDRGYYCGALGWFDPNGDFALSVPIRTIEINLDPMTHAAPFILGIGAGITIDSEAKEEWEECLIKSSFLTNLPSAVGLFETILVQNGQAQMLEDHLKRMCISASALGIGFDWGIAKTLILQSCVDLQCNQPYRLRLDLDHLGLLTVHSAPLEALPEKVKLFWAKDVLINPDDAVMYSGNVLLRHKTNSREIYDQAWRRSVDQGGFDALFINQNGFVTEGGRTSIFIKPKRSSQWLTPPISAGVLPGVMRAKFLNDPLYNTHEVNLTIADVLMADEIMLTNTLRGAILAYF